MSTRSFIGRYSEGGGRYVHCDGYPAGVGIELCYIIKRDDVDKALSVISDKDWDIIDSEENGSMRYSNGSGLESVIGYGCGKQQTSQEACFIKNVGEDSTEYGYLVEDNGNIHVLNRSGEIGCINAFDGDAIDKMEKLQ